MKTVSKEMAKSVSNEFITHEKPGNGIIRGMDSGSATNVLHTYKS